jgi:hypothetical protein
MQKQFGSINAFLDTIMRIAGRIMDRELHKYALARTGLVGMPSSQFTFGLKCVIALRKLNFFAYGQLRLKTHFE